MKTLAEFILRLQDDAAFEKQAQAFDRGEDLIAFVKREGYDFTLEQLMNELEPAETGGLAPADINPPLPPGPGEAEFPGKPEAWSSGERSSGLFERGNNDFTREPPSDRFPPPKDAMPLPVREEEPRAGVFRGSGGRHRGFSPQRLKSIAEEDPGADGDNQAG